MVVNKIQPVNIQSIGVTHAPRRSGTIFTGGQKKRITFAEGLKDKYKIHVKTLGKDWRTKPDQKKLLGRTTHVQLYVQDDIKGPHWVLVNVGSLRRLGIGSRKEIIKAAEDENLEKIIRDRLQKLTSKQAPREAVKPKKTEGVVGRLRKVGGRLQRKDKDKKAPETKTEGKGKETGRTQTKGKGKGTGRTNASEPSSDKFILPRRGDGPIRLGTHRPPEGENIEKQRDRLLCQKDQKRRCKDKKRFMSLGLGIN